MVTTALLHAPAGAVGASGARQLDVPAQPLAATLVRLGREFGVVIIAPEPLVRDVGAGTVAGRMGLAQALERSLAGTRLEWRRSPGGGVVIEAAEVPERPAVLPLSPDAATAPRARVETLLVTGRHAPTTLRADIPVQDLSRSIQSFDAPLMNALRPWGV